MVPSIYEDGRARIVRRESRLQSEVRPTVGTSSDYAMAPPTKQVQLSIILCKGANQTQFLHETFGDERWVAECVAYPRVVA